jgi:hypothetical protein
MAEVWTKMEIKMATPKGYAAVAKIFEKLLDEEESWPVENYDEENMTIEIEEVLATEDEACELGEILDKQFNGISASQKDEEIKKFFRTLEFKIKGTTEYYSSGETKGFIVERKESGVTIKETELYSSFDRDQFEDYDDFCDRLDELNCNLDEIPSEEEFENAFIFFVTYKKVYINNEPEYIEKGSNEDIENEIIELIKKHRDEED